MHSSIKDLRYFAVVAGGIYLAAFTLTGWKFQNQMTVNCARALWDPKAAAGIHAGWPIPMTGGTAIAPEIRNPLRLAIRAKHLGYEGGSLVCGHAMLELPKGASEVGGTFLLENASASGLAYDVDFTAYDLSLNPTLRIYYGDTQYGRSGLDPGDLRVCRELAEGEFERVPAWIDRENQCIVAEIATPGRYVVV